MVAGDWRQGAQGPRGGVEDTVPKILCRNHSRYPSRVAMRKKRLGIWQQYTWRDVYDHVRLLCLGFIRVGLHRGDRVVIIGNNDPELFWTEWGVQSAGGIAVCLYVDSLAEEVKYFVNDCGARFFVGEDQEQIDKFVAIGRDCPTVEKAMYWDPKGLWSYDERCLLALGTLEELGRTHGEQHPTLFDESVDRGRGDDVAVLIYTSGTTGRPKGVMVPYEGILEYPRHAFPLFPLRPWDEYVSYASPAWAEQLIGMALGPDFPLVTSFPEEPETVQADIREISPHFLWYPPRLWEDLAKQIRVKAMDSTWWRQLLFDGALAVGYRVLGYQEAGKPVPVPWRIALRIADAVVLRRARDAFGLRRVRFCSQGGSASAPELTRFFRALGATLCNNYGISEVGMISGTLPSETRYDSVGRPYPRVEVKIEDGEILVKKPGMVKGYWNNAEGWREKMQDGWYRTGDAGWIDEDQHIVYWDRKEELVELKDGTLFSPQFLETRLRFSPYIKDAIVYGGRARAFVTAIVAIDFGMTGKWCELNRVPYTTYTELSQRPEVLELLRGAVEKVNKLVPAGGRIRSFVSLHKELDPDEAELTRSRKLRRSLVERKCEGMIAAMYDDLSAVEVSATVTYEDGRKGVVTATLAVNRLA